MVKLFVGGFPLDLEELELAQLFGPYGDISTIKIVRDKKTGICKGYAFIEMPDRIAAENAAIALDGAFMRGRQLKVNLQEEPKYSKVSPMNQAGKKKRPRIT